METAQDKENELECAAVRVGWSGEKFVSFSEFAIDLMAGPLQFLKSQKRGGFYKRGCQEKTLLPRRGDLPPAGDPGSI
jgi:hypothetical protein